MKNKMRLNNKGYMLIEIIVASVITFSVAYYLLNLIYKFKNVNEDIYETTFYDALKINLTKNIYNDMNDKGVFLIGYDDTGEEKYAEFIVQGERKRLIIKGKDLKYGKYNINTNVFETSDPNYYQKKIPDYMEIKDIKLNYDKGVLAIKIPITSIYNKKSKDINLMFRCKKINQIISEEGFEFSAIGTYGFAVAGANNAYHGNSFGSTSGIAWNKKPPKTDFYRYRLINKIKYLGIENESQITNITGSTINTNHRGRIIKAYLGFYSIGTDGSINYPSNFKGKVLLLKPHDKYSIINIYPSIQAYRGFIDITNELKADNPDGIIDGDYYVSFLRAGLAPQTSWGLFMIYEDSNLPLREIKVVKKSQLLEGGQTSYIDFGEIKNTGNDIEISGMVIGGGKNGWNISETTTGDKFYAKLDNGSMQQLYATNYNGKSIFQERNSNDFFRGVYNAKNNLNHEYPGGELDVFDETLTTTFFGNHTVTGYRVEKTGTDSLYLGMFGLAHEISMNNVQ